MYAYRPPEKSIWQKASENLTVQLTLILLIAVGAIFFIMQNHKDSIFSRVKFLRGSSTQVTRSENGNQFLPETPDSNEVVLAEEVTEEAFSSEPNPKSSPIDPPPSSEKKPETKITYYEIPTSVLSKWLEDGVLTRVETYEGVTIAYIPQFNKILELSRGQIKVVKETRFPYALNQLHAAKLEAQPIAGAPTANRVLAQEAQVTPPLSAYATIDDERDETIYGQLEVSTGPQSSIPAHFEMTSDVSFFMSGFSKSRNFERTPNTELVVILQVSK